MGDRLEPDEITGAFGITPTLAYRKGEVFKRSRGHEVRGRTGLWLLRSEDHVRSTELADHFTYLRDVLGAQVVGNLLALMKRDGLHADVTSFWYGEHGATPPEIAEETRAAFARIGATIETDFQTD